MLQTTFNQNIFVEPVLMCVDTAPWCTTAVTPTTTPTASRTAAPPSGWRPRWAGRCGHIMGEHCIVMLQVGRGKCLVATRDIKQGELILRQASYSLTVIPEYQRCRVTECMVTVPVQCSVVWVVRRESMRCSCRDSPLVQSPYTRSRAQCLQCCRLLTSPAHTCTRYIAYTRAVNAPSRSFTI